ncbi:MAG: Hpt domain-containing protein [Myxococcales bacterium]|nr:Hpt domain-containing protein [Myxococcales bacterium]
MLEDGQLARILILTTDITETRLAEVALEKPRQQRDTKVRELHSAFSTEPAILEQLADVAKETLREAEGLRTSEDLADPGGKLHRDLHTLKGNSGTLDFDHLASAAGALEDLLASVRTHPDPGDWEKWRGLLPELAGAIERLEGLREKRNEGSAGSLSVNRERFDSILGLLHAEGIDGPTAALRLEALDAVPFSRCCAHYPRLLKSQAERLGKTEPELNIHGAKQLIPRSIVRVFDTCLVHLIRNAIAHGIEDDATRASRGKSRWGKIDISAEIGDEWAVLSVSDDGAGIDTERLVQKALEAEHLSETEASALSDQDKLDLVFRVGLSSRESVDELSGRGVGMDAVKHTVERQGGTIAVRSRLGEGVEVTIRLSIRKPELPGVYE